MLTIENIYNDRSLERHREGLFINNQRIFALAPIFENNDDKPNYYTMFTGHVINGQAIFLEKVIVRKDKKIKIPMIPFRNDSKWS